MTGKFLSHVQNCFWLVLPPLVIDGLFARSLPAAFQPDVFWRDIPVLLAWTENATRLVVIAFTFLLPLPIDSPGSRRAGFVLYLLGLMAYGASWGALVVWPESRWSLSAAGFSAPAWTPLLWLGGIGLIADGPLIRRLPSLRWLYWLLVIGFVAAHLSHTLLVHSRLSWAS